MNENDTLAFNALINARKENVRLAKALARMTAARDEACNIADLFLDQREGDYDDFDHRIDELREVGK